MSSMEISETLLGITPDINPTGSKEGKGIQAERVDNLLLQIRKNTFSSPGRSPFISQENILRGLEVFNLPSNSEFADIIRKNAVETNAVIRDLKNTLGGIGEELLIRETRIGKSVSEESYYAAYGINLLVGVLNRTGNDQISYVRRLDTEDDLRSKRSGSKTHDPDKVYIFESVPTKNRRKPLFVRWFIRPNTYRGEYVLQDGSVVKDVREARTKLEIFSPELPYKNASIRIDSPPRLKGGIEFDGIIGGEDSNILDGIYLSESTRQEGGHHFAGQFKPSIPISELHETITTKLMQNT